MLTIGPIGKQAKLKRRFGIAVKGLLSAALFWWIGSSFDLHQVAMLLARLTPFAMVLSFVLVLLQTVLLGLRWYRVVTSLGGVGLTRLRSVHWVFVGLFFNQALPGSVGGDLVRVWKLKQLGNNVELAFASVAIERVTGLVLLSLLVTSCVWAVWGVVQDPSYLIPLVGIGPGMALALVGVYAWYEWLGALMPSRLKVFIAAFGWGLRRITVAPREVLEISFLGIAASLMAIVSAYVVCVDLGVVVSFPALVALLGASILLSVLPISVGGWGVREASAVSLLGLLGVAPEQALSISIVYGLLPLLVSLPVGLSWCFFGGSHIPDGEDAPGSRSVAR